jgi:hypothetical protein
MVALSASRLVCLAIASMVCATLAICSSAWRRPAILLSIAVALAARLRTSARDDSSEPREADISEAACPAFLAAFSTAPAMRSLAATIASAADRSSSNCWAWLVTTLATSSIEPAASANCTPREPAFSAIVWAKPGPLSDAEPSDSRIMRTSSVFISKT